MTKIIIDFVMFSHRSGTSLSIFMFNPKSSLLVDLGKEYNKSSIPSLGLEKGYVYDSL